MLSYLLNSFIIIVKYLKIGNIGRTQKICFNVAEKSPTVIFSNTLNLSLVLLDIYLLVLKEPCLGINGLQNVNRNIIVLKNDYAEL